HRRDRDVRRHRSRRHLHGRADDAGLARVVNPKDGSVLVRGEPVLGRDVAAHPRGPPGAAAGTSVEGRPDGAPRLPPGLAVDRAAGAGAGAWRVAGLSPWALS